MSNSHQAKYFAKYKLKAKNAHGIHSPFVFDLYNAVFDNKHVFHSFQILNSLRVKYLMSDEEILVTDFGAGSHKMKNGKRKISRIARYSTEPAKYAELLFRLVNYFQPETIIETGTSLGLTTAYFALANSKTRVYSIEGDKSLCEVAKNNFSTLNINNVECINGKIEIALPETLNKIEKVDFAFIDAHHTYEATIKQFEWLLTKSHEKTILIFDDIYWSEGMTKAWEEIKNHGTVKATIDIYKMGMVFFREAFKNKEHFVVRY